MPTGANTAPRRTDEEIEQEEFEKVDIAEKTKYQDAINNIQSNLRKLRTYVNDPNTERLSPFCYELFTDSIQGTVLEDYMIKECLKQYKVKKADTNYLDNKIKRIRTTIECFKTLAKEHLEFLQIHYPDILEAKESIWKIKAPSQQAVMNGI